MLPVLRGSDFAFQEGVCVWVVVSGNEFFSFFSFLLSFSVLNIFHLECLFRVLKSPITY